MLTVYAQQLAANLLYLWGRQALSVKVGWKIGTQHNDSERTVNKDSQTYPITGAVNRRIFILVDSGFESL